MSAPKSYIQRYPGNAGITTGAKAPQTGMPSPYFHIRSDEAPGRSQWGCARDKSHRWAIVMLEEMAFTKGAHTVKKCCDLGSLLDVLFPDILLKRRCCGTVVLF